MPSATDNRLIRYLTGRQLAYLLNVNPITVQRHIADGRLKPDARAGEMTLFRSDRINALADTVANFELNRSR